MFTCNGQRTSTNIKFQMSNAPVRDEAMVYTSFKCQMHASVMKNWSQASNVKCISVSNVNCISVFQFQMSNAFHIHRSLLHFASTDNVFGSGCSTVQVSVRFGFLPSFHFASIDHFSMSHPLINKDSLSLLLHTIIMMRLKTVTHMHAFIRRSLGKWHIVLIFIMPQPLNLQQLSQFVSNFENGTRF